MFGYTLLTEDYCQSATGVKNAIVFYYIHSMILFCLMHVIPAHSLCKVFSVGHRKIYGEIVLPEIRI